MSRTVNWDRGKFALLCDAHKNAKAAKQPMFEITVKPEGLLVLDTAYAGYLIEYLDSQFKRQGAIRQPDNEGEESYTPGSGSWEGEGRL